MDLALTNTTALTMTGDGVGPIDDATVGIEDGEVVSVGNSSSIDTANATQVIDCSDALVMPGLVDAHAHMGLTLLRGGAQDVPEIQWMNQALAPFARRLEPEDMVAGARLGVAEAVKAGATTICEYGSHVERLIEDVYEPVGVRVVATETINEIATARDDLGPKEVPAFDRSQGAAALERTEALFDQFADHDRVSVTYGPQAVDMVTEETLREVQRRSAAHDCDVHMHVAQGEREQLQVEARFGDGASAVGVLEELGLANERLLAAHLHGASTRERRRLASAGARMVGCPSSIGLIDGIVPPVLEYANHGGVVGLGTDQAPGNGRHDVLREARTAAMLTKAKRTDPRALPVWQALRMATIGGARALGIDDRVGTIEEGKRADLVIVDLDREPMIPAISRPFHTAIPNLVYGAEGSTVRDVLVDGEFVVRDGAVQGLAVDEVRDEAQERAARIFEAGAAVWQDARSALVDDVRTDRI